MEDTDQPEVQIYQLRAVLRGISPLIWRRLLVRSDSTVAQLHEALQVAFGWDDDHLNRFEIRGREYTVYRDGGGMDGIDARGVRLDGLKLRRLERFFGVVLDPRQTVKIRVLSPEDRAMSLRGRKHHAVRQRLRCRMERRAASMAVARSRSTTVPCSITAMALKASSSLRC